MTAVAEGLPRTTTFRRPRAERAVGLATFTRRVDAALRYYGAAEDPRVADIHHFAGGDNTHITVSPLVTEGIGKRVSTKLTVDIYDAPPRSEPLSTPPAGSLRSRVSFTYIKDDGAILHQDGVRIEAQQGKDSTLLIAGLGGGVIPPEGPSTLTPVDAVNAAVIALRGARYLGRETRPSPEASQPQLTDWMIENRKNAANKH
jgi:hypothetical protein